MRLYDRLWLLMSQTVNALFYGGDPDESLSARRFREGKPQGIDKWLGQGHCQAVYRLAQERAEQRFNSPLRLS